MGVQNGAYKEEYPPGTIVKIADRPTLDEFRRTWQYHNKLLPEQLEYAGKVGRVKSVAFYHGGDELYVIEEVPGIWHEQCLRPHSE